MVSLFCYPHLHPRAQMTSAKSRAESPAMYAGSSPSKSTPNSDAMATARWCISWVSVSKNSARDEYGPRYCLHQHIFVYRWGMIKQVRALKPPSGQYGDTSNEVSPLLYSLFTTATHIARFLQNVLLSIFINAALSSRTI